jgi:hypothetical protein
MTEKSRPGRRRKFDEETGVLSVRLPVSLIDRLDRHCLAKRLEKSDIFVKVLESYLEHGPTWVASLAWVLVGGGTALLAAWQFGTAPLSERMAPVRNRPLVHYESGAPAPMPALAPPLVFPIRDVRLNDAWSPGNLQGLIPRRVEVPPAPERAPEAKIETQQPPPGIRSTP